MNTIERSLSVLRGVALAGLGAAAMLAAAPVQASIDASTAAGLGATGAACGQALLRHFSPLGRAPFTVPAQPLSEPILVAPACGSRCERGQDSASRPGSEQASEPKALPAPVLMAPNCPGCIWRHEYIAPASLLLAGGDPPLVVDSWWRRLFS